MARLVARLDGMPLAIELAAARVEALGVAQLLDRIGDRFALLAGGDRIAPSRQRSLAATMEWSYLLLEETEQAVFRAVSVFPGPFTLEAAEAVAGPGASPAVLRRVDCSLLVPPQPGPDGRSRYVMLETLRAYGTPQLTGAGELDDSAAALAGYALRVAEGAAVGLRTTRGEQDAVRWLDAEKATIRQALDWPMDHDAALALRLTVALAPWWLLRGRLAGEYQLLRGVAAHAAPGSDDWYAAQFWLGTTAVVCSADLAAALGHFTAVRDATWDQGPSRALADALASRSVVLSNLGRMAEAVDDGRRALAVARESGYPAGEVLALERLSIAAYYAGDLDGAVRLARQAGQVPADIPGWLARNCSIFVAEVLGAAGDLAAAERICTEGLAQSLDTGDLWSQVRFLIQMTMLELRAGRTDHAAAHLRQALQIGARTGGRLELTNALAASGYLCAVTGRPAEAITVWAASAALMPYEASVTTPAKARRRQELLHTAQQALGPAPARAAQERGVAMSWATATEYALMLTAPGPPQPAAPASGKLSARERELVALVAQGRTNAQIAAELFISVRTVGSHLDRIRDKTGCRRRADLIRLALSARLVKPGRPAPAPAGSSGLGRHRGAKRGQLTPAPGTAIWASLPTGARTAWPAASSASYQELPMDSHVLPARDDGLLAVGHIDQAHGHLVQTQSSSEADEPAQTAPDQPDLNGLSR